MDTQTQDTPTAVEHVFQEQRNFILIGLTGRTGSGCSTAAKLLCENKPSWPDNSTCYSSQNDIRKYNIIKSFAKENWQRFECIQVSHIISRFLFLLNYEEFMKFISDTLETEIDIHESKFKEFNKKFNKINAATVKLKEMRDKTDTQKETKAKAAVKYFFSEIRDYSDTLKKFL